MKKASAVERAENRGPLEEVERLEQLVPKFGDEARLRRDLAAELLQEAEGIEQIVTGIKQVCRLAREEDWGTFPEQNGHATHNGDLRGMAAVREVMRTGGVWTAGQVHDELQRRGWVSPEAQHPMRATEAAINRLWRKNGEVERVGRGQYRYTLAPTDQASLANGSEEP